jgi:hypothetical protein
MYVPGEQVVHVLEPVEDAKVPDAQSKQSVTPVPPYLPVKQGVQAALDDAPVSCENVPAPHAMQAFTVASPNAVE